MRHSLAHLADAVLRLTAGETEDVVVFDTQRGEYHIDFRRAGEVAELSVWQFEDEDSRGSRAPDRGRPVLEGWCRLSELRTQVTAALERILAEHGLAGYRDMSVDYDFPLDQLVKLRQLGARSAHGGV